MRVKRFFYNSISTAFYQLIVMIAGFITPRIMLKYYGSEINGLVSSINQFIVYFNLVEAGLSGAAIYSLYKPLAERNHKEINSIVSAARKFYMQSGYIFVSLVFGLAIFYPYFIKTDILTPQDICFLVLVLGGNGVLEFFTLSKYRVLLSADQKTYIISMASIIHIIVNTIIIVILGTLKINIVILRLVALLSLMLRSLILMIYVKKKYSFIDYREKPNTKALNKRWDALYLQILGAIHQGAPIVILTLITKDLMIVSIYTIYNMVVASVNGMLSIFKSGLSASFGDVIAKGQKETLQKSYNEFEFSYYLILTVVYAVTLSMIMPFVKIYTSGVNDVNYNVPLVGFMFVINGLFYNLKTPQGMLIISAGLFRETRIQTTIQGLIVVFGGVILTPFIGIYGVIIASLLSNIYRNIDLLYFIPRNITNLPIRLTAYRMLRVFITIILVCLALNFINTNSNSYIEWFIRALHVGVLSFIITLFVGWLFEKVIFKNSVLRILSILK